MLHRSRGMSHMPAAYSPRAEDGARRWIPRPRIANGGVASDIGRSRRPDLVGHPLRHLPHGLQANRFDRIFMNLSVPLQDLRVVNFPHLKELSDRTR